MRAKRSPDGSGGLYDLDELRAAIRREDVYIVGAEDWVLDYLVDEAARARQLGDSVSASRYVIQEIERLARERRTRKIIEATQQFERILEKLKR